MAKRAPSTRRNRQDAPEIADWLTSELERRHKKPHWLYVALKGDKQRGPVSYKTVLSYVNGDTEPRVGVLHEIEGVLGTSYARLLPGAGPGVGDDAATRRRQFEEKRTEQLAEKRAEIRAMQEQFKAKELSEDEIKRFSKMDLNARASLPPAEARRWADFKKLSKLVLEAEALRVAVPLGEAALTPEDAKRWADRKRHEQRVRAAFAQACPVALGEDAATWAAAERPWHYACWRFAPQPKADEWVTIGPAAELAAAKAVGRALALPLRALRVGDYTISPWQFNQYVRLASAALEVVLVGTQQMQARRHLRLTVEKSRGRARGTSARRSRQGGTQRP